MQLEIISPEKMIFSGEITNVILPGSEGYFEILNNHAPIISLLNEGQVKYTLPSGEKLQLDITSGFAEVNNNKVTVLV